MSDIIGMGHFNEGRGVNSLKATQYGPMEMCAFISPRTCVQIEQFAALF